MARGFVYLAVVLDWFSRRILAWRLSITMEVSFCVAALEDALAHHGKPAIVNTDQGSQFTGSALSREESDVVPLAHQLLSQERNHPFRAPVKLGRHTFVKRSNLSNPQRRCHLTNRAWQANASVKVSVPRIELDDRSR